nr:MAG TPA: hypothetical protein [Caudoviricetes sp.]
MGIRKAHLHRADRLYFELLKKRAYKSISYIQYIYQLIC